MSHRMLTAYPESRSAAAISAKFKTEVKAIYEQAETSNKVNHYSKSFYEHLQNLPSEIDNEISVKKLIGFVGGKNENAYVRKNLREISNDVKSLDFKKYLSSVESALLKFQLKIQEIEELTEGSSLESLKELKVEKDAEWKITTDKFKANLQSANTRFSFLDACASMNYDLCAAQISELVSTTEFPYNTRTQFKALNSRMTFLTDSIKLISSVKTPCLNLSADICQCISSLPKDSESLFIGSYDGPDATAIIKDFMKRCRVVLKKWEDMQIKGERVRMYIRAMDRCLVTVNIKTDFFLTMCQKLEHEYFNAIKNANERILYKTSLDNMAGSFKKIELAEQVVVHAHKVLDELADMDTTFQPSCSTSSSDA